MKKYAFVLMILTVAMAAGCSGSKNWSEDVCYDASVEALLANPDLPAGLELPPQEECKLFAGKSAATVAFPVNFVDKDGKNVSGEYVVSLFRVATRWTVKTYEFRSDDRPTAPKDDSQGPPAAPSTNTVSVLF